MLDAQVHRGPDDWGLLVPANLLSDSIARPLLERRGMEHVRSYPAVPGAPAAILGSRRLSIIDTSSNGRMPMASRDGCAWLTYNGEIYNFKELRSSLQQAGHEFASGTDSEAIIEGYVERGERIVESLRGMFAFAILD